MQTCSFVCLDDTFFGRFMVHCQRQHPFLLTLTLFFHIPPQERKFTFTGRSFSIIFAIFVENFSVYFTLRISNTKSFELRLIECFWKVGQMLLLLFLLVFFGKNEISSPF